MPTCKCGNTFSKKRAALGYSTCLSCGDNQAKNELKSKSKRFVDMHKSGSTYLGSDEQTQRKNLLAITRMRRT